MTDTIDALLADFTTTGGDSDSFTTQELCALRGYSTMKARGLIKMALAAGRVEPCKKQMTAMNGYVTVVPAYRAVAKSKPRK